MTNQNQTQDPAMENEICIPYRMLTTAALFACRDETWFIINSVYVRPMEGQVSVVATNGRVLFCTSFKHEGKATPEFCIPLDMIPRLPQLQGRKKRDNMVSLAYNAANKEILSQNVESKLAFGCMESRNHRAGKYPKFQEVHPYNNGHTQGKVTFIGLNGQYLDIVIRAFAMLYPTDAQRYSLRMAFTEAPQSGHPELSQVLIYPVTKDHWTGYITASVILMPMRDEWEEKKMFLDPCFKRQEATTTTPDTN